jgi:hypothetical protein
MFKTINSCTWYLNPPKVRGKKFINGPGKLYAESAWPGGGHRIRPYDETYALVKIKETVMELPYNEKTKDVLGL